MRYMQVGARYIKGNTGSLARFISAGIDSIVVSASSAIGVPHAIWLITADREIVKIISEMIEIEERFEVGRLVFSFDDEPPANERRFDLPLEWRPVFAAELLYVKEHPPWVGTALSVDVEAGLRITVATGRTWAITVGAQPCTLALDAPFIAAVSYPQYSIGDYRSRVIR